MFQWHLELRQKKREKRNALSLSLVKVSDIASTTYELFPLYKHPRKVILKSRSVVLVLFAF